MHSNKSIISLQLISISITFIFLLLPLRFSTGLVLKPECQDRCGNLSIPYPFGVGSVCSLDPSFDITCDTSTDPPKAYLSIIDAEVIYINQTDNYIRVKYPNPLVSVCYDGSYNYSMPVNLSGTPYTLSEENDITVIGCDDMMVGFYQSNESSISGGCSALCTDKKDSAGGFGYCPYNAISLSNGCCKGPISSIGDKDFLRAQLVDWSEKLERTKFFPCSYAFIQERVPNETEFSYPLYYLNNSTAFLNDNWTSSTRPPAVRLDWSIGVENCNQAQLNSTYACKDSKTVCVDNTGNDRIHKGYLCSCVPGYEGNPYLPQGCMPISFSSSIAKYGCPDQCGRLSIPYPFGVGPDCALAPSFEIYCNTSTNPPVAYLSILNAEISGELDSSQVLVDYRDEPSSVCYNLSDNQRRISTIANQSLIINLSKTQYTLSDNNWITAVGCDSMVVGNVGHGNRSSIGIGCATICSDKKKHSNGDIYGYCPSGTNMYRPGDGCCRTPIPRGTSHLEANLIDISGQWPSTDYSCSYVFVQYMYENLNGYRFPYSITNDITKIQSYEVSQLMLDWRIGTVNCKEAKQNETTYACKNNSDCVDFDATVGGYLCNCSKGYQGNPYLNPGCQDIDECADNPCDIHSTCINIAGSVKCSCQKGYYGDGRKDGSGCTRPQKSSKMIIGLLSSGLGFMLLLLVSFWLRKVLRKRKSKKHKEDLFKHLLQKHTNEYTFGRTKLFQAKELEKATDHFNENRILGKGGQGIVYKGMLHDGTIVAIKKLKYVDEDQVEQFINEVVILSQINHRNVVKLLGCCLSTEVPLLVYEFLPNGTLFDFIHDSSTEFPLSWNMRLKIATDVAGALAYLHFASSVPIYHRDIKSSNFLLDEKWVVKVADFGISRSVAVDQTHLTTIVKGTFGYFDPEYFQSRQYTEKSDVFSFGVVLAELLTGRRPIFRERSEEVSLATYFPVSMEENNLDAILDPHVSEHNSKEEVIAVARVAKRCLSWERKNRPTMKEVSAELESLRIFHMTESIKDESKDARIYDANLMMISNNEDAWTTSSSSETYTTSSDMHPLRFESL